MKITLEHNGLRVLMTDVDLENVTLTQLHSIERLVSNAIIRMSAPVGTTTEVASKQATVIARPPHELSPTSDHARSVESTPSRATARLTSKRGPRPGGRALEWRDRLNTLMQGKTEIALRDFAEDYTESKRIAKAWHSINYDGQYTWIKGGRGGRPPATIRRPGGKSASSRQVATQSEEDESHRPQISPTARRTLPNDGELMQWLVKTLPRVNAAVNIAEQVSDPARRHRLRELAELDRRFRVTAGGDYINRGEM